MKKVFRTITLLVLCLALVLTSGCGASKPKVPDTNAPKTNDTSKSQGRGPEFYNSLPFKEIYSLEEGPIKINGQEKKIKIGFSQTGLNHPWRVEMIESAKAEVARHSNVSIIVTDGNVDIVKQSSDISDLLAQGVDAIVMSPVESGGLVNATKKAMDAGVPVIVLDRDVYGNKTLFLGQSNFSMGAKVAEVLAKKLNGKGNVLEITGLMGSSPAIGRHDGFMSIMKNYPDIKVLAQGDGQWIREPAVKLMEDWLTAYKHIDAVFSHAEESSWGADLAITRANRTSDKIMHFTMDGSNEGFRSVKSGQFEADGNYTPYIGQLGVRAALYSLMGKELTGKQKYQYGDKVDLPDSPVVVKENADEWISKGWGK